jgi:hypothetical protein
MLKDFYKPTKEKIILMIIILVLHVAVGFYGLLSNFCLESFEGYHINDCPKQNLFDNILMFVGLPLVMVFGTSVFGIYINAFVSVVSSIFGLFLLVFFWYSLSCGVVKIKPKYFSK